MTQEYLAKMGIHQCATMPQTAADTEKIVVPVFEVKPRW